MFFALYISIFAQVLFNFYWKHCMRKIILPFALSACALVNAAEVEVHGDVNMDYASYFDEDFDPTNAGNQDIDLALHVHLDENISVIVKGNTHSTFTNSKGETEQSEVRHGFAHATAMGDGGRYNSFDFDGVQFRWDVSQDVTLVFGDMTYSAGAFNYYFWRDVSRYAVIVREEKLRGVGVDVGNEKYGQGSFYIGASDDTDHTLSMFLTYALPLLNRTNEHLIIKPSFDWVFGEDIGRSYTYTMGAEVDYSKSFDVFNYGVYAVWGLHPYKGKGVHSFLVEPSMNYSIFNLGLTYFYTITDTDYDAEPQLFTDDQLLFAIEPSFNLHKKFTMGVTYEYHDPDTEIDDDDFHFLGMNFYIYPTLKTEIVCWFGYNFSDNEDNPYADAKFAMGFSGKASF